MMTASTPGISALCSSSVLETIFPGNAHHLNEGIEGETHRVFSAAFL